MRTLTLLAATLALHGCDAAGPVAGDLRLDVRGDAFALGAEAEATVTNTTGRTLYLYDCGGRILLDVQERTGAGWEPAGFVNNDCPTTRVVPYRLGAGEAPTVAFALEAPGTYRLSTYFGTRPGPGTDVGAANWTEAVSEPFRVEAVAP